MTNFLIFMFFEKENYVAYNISITVYLELRWIIIFFILDRDIWEIVSFIYFLNFYDLLF